VDCSGIYQSSVKYRLEKTMAGYVQILNFEAGTAQDAIDAIEELLNQGAVALVVDLRGNPGGLDTEVADFLNYLLPSGTLFVRRDKDGHEDITTSDGMCIQLPMVVLINGDTYAEAEVCAAVLKEFQWATILGEPTTGKTRTQETIALSDGSAIRLSTGTYLTGGRVDISAAGGVTPEYIIHNADPNSAGTTAGTTGESTGTGATSTDEQLMNALKMLS
jgi:carboxyl-terminal processing protease